MSEFDLEVGSTVSHFRLEKKLGEGGMGAVYAAEDLTLGRRVAIKFMSRRLLAQQASPEVRANIEQRFIREARSAAAINHPNITQIFEANFDSDNWFIAMELVKGAELADHLASGRQFTPAELLDITRQTIAGLKHAWDDYKIIHRDIKPQNIMLTKTGGVKIVDLGLAKPVAETDEDLPELTGAGTPIGTPQYMAPEQATGETDLDFRVDIYALGATLYEIATGKKAFNGKTAPMIYMAQMAKKYPPAHEARPDLPVSFSELIDKMLEPKRDDRIGSYDACLAALVGGSSEAVAGFDNAATVISEAETLYSQPKPSTPTSDLGDHTHISTILGFSIGASPYLPTDHLIVDRYRVMKPIGRSRAGLVYHCFDKQAGVECAVKTLAPGREFPASAMAGVKRNFQRLLSKSHPNLAQIRDLHEDPKTGELYVVMELLSGRNFREYTHRLTAANGDQPPTWEQMEPVVQRIATALDSINGALGIAHGDVKPESIFLSKDDTEVKLIDYGITEMVMADTTSMGQEMPSLPLANADYMAPEVWQMKPTSARTDQYALAVVVWEALGRRLPFWLRDGMEAGADAATVITDAEALYDKLRERVVNEPPPEHPVASGNLAGALKRALSKDPSARFPTCAAMVAATRGGGIPVVPLAIAAAVLIAVGIGAMMFAGGDKPPEISKVPDTVPTQPVPSDGGEDNPDGPDDGGNNGTGDGDQQPPEQGPVDGAAAAAQALAAAEQAAREKAAAAEEAAREQAAKAHAEKQAQLRRERQAVTARSMRNTVAKLRDKLAANRYLTEASFQELDAAMAAADEKIKAEEFAAAVTALNQATAVGERLKTQGDQFLREDASTLGREVAELRTRLKPYEAADPKLAEKIVGIDVVLGLARTNEQQLDFQKAIGQYQQAKKSANDIWTVIQETYTPKAGRNFTLNTTGAKYVWIKTLDAWVAKYETTNGEYRRFKPGHNSGKQEGFSMNGERQPVIEISYLDAVAYCEWLNAVAGDQLPDGYRFGLPDSEQWLLVVACGTERVYPWGNEWPPKYGNYANQEIFPNEWQLDGYVTDLSPVTCKVEESGENEWGIAGMGGNVWEWTTSQKENTRAIRGGSWTSTSRKIIVCRTKGNIFAPMDRPFDNIGFRVFVLKTGD